MSGWILAVSGRILAVSGWILAVSGRILAVSGWILDVIVSGLILAVCFSAERAACLPDSRRWPQLGFHDSALYSGLVG